MTSREIQVGMLSEGNAAHEPIQSRGYQACDLSEGERFSMAPYSPSYFPSLYVVNMVLFNVPLFYYVTRDHYRSKNFAFCIKTGR